MAEITNEFESKKSKDGLTVKAWRGERMCLLGFDVDAPEPDLVGFAIECRAPGESSFYPLKNRLAFSYDKPLGEAVTGERLYDSTVAPFQKFRWLHFPFVSTPGAYTYRVTKMHMPQDGVLVKGTSVQVQIAIHPVTHHGFVDVGFTRNFSSSQAFSEIFKDRVEKGEQLNEIGAQIVPAKQDEGLSFKKMQGDIYPWLGCDAYEMIFGFLEEALKDEEVEVDMFAYDLNEPDLVERLEKLGSRLRAVIDDSTDQDANGVITGHGTTKSAESEAARRLRISAGLGKVQRAHFSGLQHQNLLIAKRNGVPFKVLGGSTDFSYRGLYVQANNVVVFHDEKIASLFEQVFESAFANPAAFKKDELSSKWHLVLKEGRPPVRLAFSPHKSSALSLNPLRGALDEAGSAVIYSLSVANQLKPGATGEALDRLMEKPLFSYGVVDKEGGLEVRKPDGSVGLVDYTYLSSHAPEPFKSEWSSGKGNNLHHKFVVTDFNLPTAKVITGSSSLSADGEKANGDHLLIIEDSRIATSYALEAIRVLDHLHFRNRLQVALSGPKGPDKAAQRLALRKPTPISGKKAWFEEYYKIGSQKERDRKLFSE